MSLDNNNEYDQAYATQQLERSRSGLRRFVKNFYLRNILKEVKGPAVDFGCGAGQLLERLPPSSLGLEVNSHLVHALLVAGMNVQHYDPSNDALLLSQLPEGFFKTFVMSHVLEHFQDAADALKKILGSCRRLGVERVIVIVPGEKGYRFDNTHRTFVSRGYLTEHGILEEAGFRAVSISYFPINMEWIGKFFVFHEMKIVYEKI